MNTAEKKLKELLDKLESLELLREEGYRYTILFEHFKVHAWMQNFRHPSNFMCIKCQATLDFTSPNSYTYFNGLNPKENYECGK